MSTGRYCVTAARSGGAVPHAASTRYCHIVCRSTKMFEKYNEVALESSFVEKIYVESLYYVFC